MASAHLGFLGRGVASVAARRLMVCFLLLMYLSSSTRSKSPLPPAFRRSRSFPAVICCNNIHWMISTALKMCQRCITRLYRRGNTCHAAVQVAAGPLADLLTRHLTSAAFWWLLPHLVQAAHVSNLLFQHSLVVWRVSLQHRHTETCLHDQRSCCGSLRQRHIAGTARPQNCKRLISQDTCLAGASFVAATVAAARRVRVCRSTQAHVGQTFKWLQVNHDNPDRIGDDTLDSEITDLPRRLISMLGCVCACLRLTATPCIWICIGCWCGRFNQRPRCFRCCIRCLPQLTGQQLPDSAGCQLLQSRQRRTLTVCWQSFVVVLPLPRAKGVMLLQLRYQLLCCAVAAKQQ